MTDAMTDRRGQPDDVPTASFPVGMKMPPEKVRQPHTGNPIRPAHYAVNGTYEVDKCLAAWGLTTCAYKYQAVAYIARAGKKDGATEITDLEKAIWNLQRRVEQLRRGEG